MKSAMRIVSLLIVSLVLGCAASAQVGGSKSAVDWKTAMVCPSDSPCYCDRNKSGEGPYFACLEEMDRRRMLGGDVAKQPAPVPTVTATATTTLPVPPQPSATAPVQQMPPAVVGGNPMPQQNVYIPGAVGPICETNKALQLVVDNQTDYLLGVRGGMSLAPLGCDAQNTLVLATVLNRDGRPEQLWIIPPHTNAIFVFLPLNGGLGQPKVVYTAYMPLACQGGVCPPSPFVGQYIHQYTVPRQNGQEIPQFIQAGMLRR
ncbi:MAG: hypothetical protein WC551_06690 [Patescibacteria group bacterium]